MKYYRVDAGPGDRDDPGFGSFDSTAHYDDFGEMMEHIAGALRAGRSVSVEPVKMTAKEYSELPDIPEGTNPLTLKP